MKYNCLYN